MPNFSSLAGLEVTEKFWLVLGGGGGGGWEHVATVSNSNEKITIIPNIIQPHLCTKWWRK